MLRLISKIQNLPVISQNTGTTVGTIDDYVLDPEPGKVVAYELKGNRRARFFSSIDVLKYFDDGVLISDSSVLQPIDELVRVKNLLKPRVRIARLAVFTEQGKRLGKGGDCLIETNGHYLAKLYVTPTFPGRIFTEGMIIPRDHIIEITPKRIIVRYHKKAVVPGPEPKPKIAS